MADLTAPAWCQPGMRVGCVRTPAGVSEPQLSYRTVKAIGKKFVTTEPTTRPGTPDRYDLRDLERREGGPYGARVQLVDPRGDWWLEQVAKAAERHRLRQAQIKAELWARGTKGRSGEVPTALEVVRALLPVAGLSDEGLADVLAALPPVEEA